MKGNLFAIFGSLVLAGTLVAAQEAQSPAPPVPRDPAPQAPAAQEPASSPDETTLTGCLVQGSGPTVFILENAKLASDKNTKGESYVLEISASPDKIKTVVNHSVTIVGTAEAKAASAAPAPGQKRSESDLPKLTAKRITPTSQTCSAQGD